MNQVKIGKFIAELRHDENMTQDALGQKIGVTNKTISRWENGNYMPDIEILELLSKIFHVSINELLCGERLSNEDYKEKADSNIISILKENTFSIKEKFIFWKWKWLKEHAVLFILYVVIIACLFAWVWFSSIIWLVGLCPLLCIIISAIIRNRMMIYIEGKIYLQNDNSIK